MKLSLLLALTLISVHTFSGPDPLYPTPREIEKLLGNNDNEYKGIDGHIKFANEYFSKDLDMARQFAIEAIGPEILQRMAWSIFLGEEAFNKFANEYKGTDRIYFRSSNLELTYSLAEINPKANGLQVNGVMDTYIRLTMLEAHFNSIEESQLGTEDLKLKRGLIHLRNTEDANQHAREVEAERKNLSAEIEELEEKFNHEQSKLEIQRSSLENKISERRLMRSILETSTGEMDYDRWFGAGDGLDSAAYEYMRQSKLHSLPYEKVELSRVRFFIESETVSEIELKKLGWHPSSILKGSNFTQFEIDTFISRKARNDKKSSKPINIHSAVKKGHK